MNGNNSEALVIENKVSKRSNGIGKARTTIGLRATTKSTLDKNRAPGQCYDGFITQLVDLWERSNSNGNGKT